eukprot:CAMPEP_0115433470 /NCGR_PEP_ID=MMETSP0271-20121206/32645_1 /TAXON_ID=71861 /ORGANISM="Scrippsiella trochoidea, Strain CCMP3099" /LENGTH=30 /DNA_ID= /DNA_START= /DNA_END= /DNA_ORIENTATION=
MQGWLVAAASPHEFSGAWKPLRLTRADGSQ